MTDSIKTTLRLTKLSARDRMDVDANITNVTNPWGELKERYTKPSHQQSAMAETMTKWVVRCARDTNHPDFGLVPTQIDADLNIPNSTVGQNLEHGTSVWAAGVAALEQQRIWMAKGGVGRAALDLLTTEDVSFRVVTITYCLPCNTQSEAQAMVDGINETGKVLNPRWKFANSRNLTVNLPERTFTVTAYIKTNLEHCAFPDGAPVEGLINQALYIVRVEVKLGLRFLQKHELVSLDSWRDAYEKGVYEAIFNATVRKALRLGQLRHKAPREEVFQRLTPDLGRLLRGYLNGRDPRKFQNVVDNASPAKRFSVLRLEILRVAKIDIDIPWAEHVKLRCFELDTQLRYPGDYVPSDAHTPWCFCKANWSSLYRQLRRKYASALATAALKAELWAISTAIPITPQPS